MGGYHVTFMDSDALSNGVVDYIVRGEGEEIFANLLNALEKGEEVENIDGISYLKNGVYIRNKDAPPPQNLDKLPLPSRELLPLDKYNTTVNGYKAANMVTSRGCPFNCYFCSSSRFGGLKWRARSPKSIVHEIEYLYNKFDYRAFEMLDDNFTLNPKRVFEFSDEVIRRKLKIIWWCFSRADTIVKNEDMVKKMAEAGLYRVFLGLESGSENVLNDYNKNISLNEQKEAIKILKKYGVLVHGSFIIGDVDETEKMIMNTVNWAKRLNPALVQFSVLTPFPGTKLYEDMEKEGRLLHHNWKEYDALHPTIKLKYITNEKLKKIYIKSYRNFYLNYDRIFKKEKINGNSIPKNEMKENHDGFIESIKYGFNIYNQLRKEVMRKTE